MSIVHTYMLLESYYSIEFDYSWLVASIDNYVFLYDSQDLEALNYSANTNIF